MKLQVVVLLALAGLPLCSSTSDLEFGVLGGCALAGVGVLISSIKVVTTGNECLIERFGRFHRKLGPGWHLCCPVMESVSMQQTIREQVLDVPPQQCYTKDNAPIKADAVVYLRIHSMYQARYSVNDLFNAVLNLVLTQIREEMGKITLDETFSSRAQLNENLLRDVNEATAPWGVEITRIEVLNIDPSPDILKAMELQMAAERRKRAAILTSEGEKAKTKNEAEGNAAAILAKAEADRQAQVLRAQAEAERLQVEAGGLKAALEALTDVVKHSGKSDKDAVDAATSIIMLRAYLDAQSRVASSNGAKVLMFPSKDSLPLTYNALHTMLGK